MTSGVLEAIDAEIALLVRLVDTPVEPFGYGVDLSCVDDISAALDEVDAFSRRAIGEALLRRLTCPRGQLPDDPNYGLDVRGYLNRATPAAELRDLAGAIQGESRKDDRVSDVAVTCAMAGLSALTITIVVTPFRADIGVFTLTLAATDGVALLEVIG